MATVELLLAALPAHVRTARLVGVAAARRAGLSDELLDELRLALGEACSRAVALHAVHAPQTPVQIVLQDALGRLTVEVTDVGPAAEPLDGPVDDLFDDLVVDPSLALMVLSGLVDDLQVVSTGQGTTVTMSWPLAS